MINVYNCNIDLLNWYIIFNILTLMGVLSDRRTEIFLGFKQEDSKQEEHS